MCVSSEQRQRPCLAVLSDRLIVNATDVEALVTLPEGIALDGDGNDVGPALRVGQAAKGGGSAQGDGGHQ